MSEVFDTLSRNKMTDVMKDASRHLDAGKLNSMKSGSDDMAHPSGVSIGSTDDMMKMLNKNPQMQSNVLNMLKRMKHDASLSNATSTSENRGVILDSSSISECVNPHGSKEASTVSQAQMVMSPYTLPGNNASYVMSTASSPSSSSQIQFCMPAENISETPPETPPETPTKIMEESSDNVCKRVVLGRQPSVDMTFVPSEMKFSNAYLNTERPFPDEEQLHTFCDKMNSPDYEYSDSADNSEDVEDYFENPSLNDVQEPPEYVVCPNESVPINTCLENSVVGPICSTNHLLASPEYVVPAKNMSLDEASPKILDCNGVEVSDDSSNSCSEPTICEESGAEGYSNEMQCNLPSNNIHFNMVSLLEYKDVANSGSCSSVPVSEMPGSLVTSVPSANKLYEHFTDPLLFAHSFSPSHEVRSLSGPSHIHPNRLTAADSPVSVASSTDGPQKHLNSSMEYYKMSSDNACSDTPLPNLSASGVPQSVLLPNPSTIFRGNLGYYADHDSQQLECRNDNQEPAKKRRKVGPYESLIDGNSDNVSLCLLQPLLYSSPAYNDIMHSNNVACNDNRFVASDDHPVFRTDDDGDLPLHRSVVKEDVVSTIKILIIMAGKKIDSKNSYQQTPFHLACYTGNVQIICLLLQSGADPAIPDTYGNNMIHTACMLSSINMLKLLGEFYVTSDSKIVEMMKSRNYEGAAPLHEATKRQNMEIIKYLIHDLDCDLDIKELKAGTTVLSYALERHEWELAQVFISCGADVNESNNAGRRPLNYVVASNNYELAKDLISRNAESGVVKLEFIDNIMERLVKAELRKQKRKNKKRSLNEI